MRIGIDARFYGTLGKGLGRYTEKLIEHLEIVDQKNEYIIFLRRENFAEYAPKNSRFRKVIAQYAWYGFSEQTVFVILLYRSRLDLVHFPHFNVPLLYWKKFVVTIHDLILVHYPTLRNTTRFAFVYWLKFFLYRLVIASAVDRAEHIITVSHFTRRDIIKRWTIAEKKITVTYEAADLFCPFSSLHEEQALFASLGLLNQDGGDSQSKTSHDIMIRGIVHPSHVETIPYFLYVGNAYPHKNLPILFALAKAFPKYTLVLVGREDYFYARLKSEALLMGIRNILFVGFLPDRELSSLYRYARAYVFPSLYEGFGLPPLEAMARGVPVISSDRGSLPEVLDDAACYFDPTSPTALVSVVRRVESDETLREAMRERGYRQVAKFRFDDMAVLTLRVYQMALKNKHQSHDASQYTKEK